MENRVLELSPDSPSLYYQYEICVRSFLGICTKNDIKRDIYDLTDPVVRKQLKDMSFIARVREKPF